MSIFRETFKPEITGSLEARQNAMTNRTVDTIQYLNSRNSWIRMVSSVDVAGLGGIPTNDSAGKNILQGGTQGILGLKSGVGDNLSKAYSNIASSGEKYRLGIRPMPGITSIDIKSKSAYGSLREVVVNFQCWDIKQLEELELLYMRPGYTVLVEWGWYPYLDNNGKIVTTLPTHYDILKKSATELSVIAKELYNKSLSSGGNYDAMFGYVKNYQWSARTDGGYDCQTTIISTGEIIESLKVNYVRPDLLNYDLYNSKSIGSGYLNPEFSSQGTAPSINFVDSFEKNTLAGVWTELFYKLAIGKTAGSFSSNGIFSTIAASRGTTADKLHIGFTDFVFNNLTNNKVSVAPLSDNRQIYITLDVALEFINKYVTAHSNGNELVKFSLRTSDISSDGKELLCLAHPLQVSVDPTVCLIKSPLWYDRTNPLNILTSTASSTILTGLITTAADIVKELDKYSSWWGPAKSDTAGITKEILKINSRALYEAVENQLQATPVQKQTTLGGIITTQFGNDIAPVNALKAHLELPEASGGPALVVDIETIPKTGEFMKIRSITAPPLGSSLGSVVAIASGLPNALAAVDVLKAIPLSYFYNDDPDTELGIIRNIYVNLDFLYRTAIDQNIESQDHKEKNEISLYKYVKNIMVSINAALGSMNNFEIHVDPTDNNVARIIDINYTSATPTTNLFELQVQNTKSIVRNYTLQSQIFPEQSAMIAIGSQVQGGQLGIQNNTMIDFNKNLLDRILPKKEFPQSNTWSTGGKNITGASLANIILLFSTFWPGSTRDAASLYAQAKNSLRDIIVYFQSIVKSSSANRSIIPIKFSFEMDGIGGLVIGHLFKINKDILPSGYYKSNLAQTITGISHTINNGDWVTKIDALNIILEDPTTKPKFSTSVDIKSTVSSALNALTSGKPYTPTGGSGSSTAIFGSFISRERKISDINSIILHDTDGNGGIQSTIDTLKKNGYGIHYIVDRDGTSFNAGPLTKRYIHAGESNDVSVGIEIANLGMLTDRNGGKDAYHATGKRQYSTTAPYNRTDVSPRPGFATLAEINNPKHITAGIQDLGFYVNGQRHHEGYTTAQANELKRIIIEILNQCPNIKLNYTADTLSIYQNVFGLKTLKSLPTKGQKLTTTRDYSSANPGIYAHAVISKDRVDAHIDPEMIRILKEIKNETGR